MIFGRRIRFAILVLISHILLIALAVAWFAQMLIIAVNGSVKFVENNTIVLIIELVLTGAITAFAIFVFVLQWKRLGERRNEDNSRKQDRRD